MIDEFIHISKILPNVVKDIVNKSIEYDRLNSPIERERSREISRIAARKRCLNKVKNLTSDR